MGFAYADFAPRGVHAAAAEQSQETCGFPDTFRGGLTRSYFVQGLSAATGREEIGGGLRALPLAPYPGGTLQALRASSPGRGAFGCDEKEEDEDGGIHGDGWERGESESGGD